MVDYIPTLQPLSSFRSAPSGYLTPAQVKSNQDYANALLYGKGQQPVNHWTQGVSNMVSALVGGNLSNQTDQRDIAANDWAGQRQRDTLNGTGAFGTGAPPVPFSEAQASEGDRKTEGGSDLDRAARVTSGQESGGNYQAMGPQTRDGDRAYGKYQIMGKNIPQWSAEALGHPVNIADFVHNPEIQDAVYKHKMGEYLAKYGPEGAGRAWLGGEGSINHPERRDSLGTSVGSYGQAFAKGFGAPTEGGATRAAFAGSGGSSEAPAVQAMGAALRGDPSSTDVAAAKTAPGPYRQQLAQASGQPPVIDPALVPRPQTNITPDQLKDLLGNAGNRLGPGVGQDMYNRAIQQGQPVSVPVTGGHVIVDPRTGRQQFFPDIHWGESGVGEIKGQEGQMVVPDGKGGFVQKTIQEQAPPPATTGPRSEAPPASPPAAPTGVMPTAAPGAPAGPATASAAPPAPLTQVASLDPTAGAVPKAMPSTVGPTALATPPAQPIAAPPAAVAPKVAAPSPLARFAQAAPPGVSPMKWQAWQALQSEKIKNAAKEEMNKEEITLGMKGYDKFKDQVSQAQDLQPKVEASLALLNDPRMHTGMAAGLQDTWSRFKEAFLGEKGANAPNELFDKLAAGQVLGIMRSTLQGLGQVRLAEINLLNKANASRFYGDSANRAVLEIARTGLEKVNQLGQMANQYVSGRDVIDPVSKQVVLKAGEGRRHGLDADFTTLAQNWADKQNEATTEKFKNYDKLFDTGRDPSGAQLGERDNHGVPVNPKVGQEHQFNDDKGNPMTGVWNGKKWGPKGK